MIGIIVISYFGAADLGPYLESLSSQSCRDWQLFIVDNTQDSAELQLLDDLSERDERVAVLRSDVNRGYFGGAEWARLQIDGENLDCIIVSNADLYLPDSHALELISSRMCPGASAIDAPTIDLLAPDIFKESTGFRQNPFMVVRPTKASMVRRRWMLRFVPIAQIAVLLSSFISGLLVAVRGSQVPPGSRNRSRIYAPHGSFIVFGKTYFEAGGSFRHPIFLFNEELTVAEFCRRLGLTIEYDPAVKIAHRVHGQMRTWRSQSVLRYQGRAAEYGLSLLYE